MRVIQRVGRLAGQMIDMPARVAIDAIANKTAEPIGAEAAARPSAVPVPQGLASEAPQARKPRGRPRTVGGPSA